MFSKSSVRWRSELRRFCSSVTSLSISARKAPHAACRAESESGRWKYRISPSLNVSQALIVSESKCVHSRTTRIVHLKPVRCVISRSTFLTSPTSPLVKEAIYIRSVEYPQSKEQYSRMGLSPQSVFQLYYSILVSLVPYDRQESAKINASDSKLVDPKRICYTYEGP
jgi:hypothetical protein